MERPLALQPPLRCTKLRKKRSGALARDKLSCKLAGTGANELFQGLHSFPEADEIALAPSHNLTLAAFQRGKVLWLKSR